MSNTRDGLIEEEVKCSCKGDNLDKFVQPLILMLLSKQPLHGYRIIQELEGRKSFQEEKLDNAGVYRTLRTFEKRKKVTAVWDVHNSGAPKKIYQITEEGRECLNHWIQTLEDYEKIIHAILLEVRRDEV